MSKYIGEATAYDKKLMLERKKPHELSWDSLPSGYKRVNFAFETLRAEYFVRAKVEFVESDFDSLGLVTGISPRPQNSVESSVKTVDKTVDWSVDRSVDWNVDRTCDQVLSILKTNPRATLDQVANVVGLSVRGIEQAIKRLKKAKRIRKVGGKRFGHWEVKE